MIDMSYTITGRELVEAAASLHSEHGENAEYDRALTELTTRALGLRHDRDGAVVASLIERIAS